jgi:hypothetical protein
MPRFTDILLHVARPLGVLAVWAVPLAATAQPQEIAAPFLGTWKATWTADVRSYEAKMVLTPSGGTWKAATLIQNNPCAGREVPVKVESASAGEVQLLLAFSEALQGCPNSKVVLRAGPDGKVSGMRSRFELTLVREP